MGAKLASDRDHEQLATAVIQHVMHRESKDEPHHIAAKVLQTAKVHAGKLFRPDHVYDTVRTASQPHRQWRTLSNYGPDALNDVLDHVFLHSGELRQPAPENVGDVSRQRHADRFLSRVRAYQRGEDVDETRDPIMALLQGASIDAVLEAAMRLPDGSGFFTGTVRTPKSKKPVAEALLAAAHDEGEFESALQDVVEAPGYAGVGSMRRIFTSPLGSVTSQQTARKIVRPASREWTDQSFGDVERKREIRQRIHAQAPVRAAKTNEAIDRIARASDSRASELEGLKQRLRDKMFSYSDPAKQDQASRLVGKAKSRLAVRDAEHADARRQAAGDRKMRTWE